jgi:lon-related putative ATP-dependent protease
MTQQNNHPELGVEQLRWRMDPSALPFSSTDEVAAGSTIIGQDRGVEALRFGLGMLKPGYNVFVTGQPGSGRMNAVKELLDQVAGKDRIPDDLCYVNNFKNSEAPILLTLPAGQGARLRREVHELVEGLKKDVPQLFESQDYINRKKEILDTYEKKSRDFFRTLEAKVKETGFVLVNVQRGQIQRPEVMPLVDNEPTPMVKLEEMVEKGRFPREEFESLREQYEQLKVEIDEIFMEIRELQKEVQRKDQETDKLMFMSLVQEQIPRFHEKYDNETLDRFLEAMVDDMAENLKNFLPQQQQGMPGMPMMVMGDPLAAYEVNVLVDNAEQKGVPVIVESYPTYRNLFGSIERIVDRSGVWRTDFSRIKAGSFIKANGGYLVLNFMDAVMEPGVWPALKRALKSRKMEIQTYDPFYLFTTTGLKPEPIDMDVKVIVLVDPYIYALLHAYDEDVPKIFKVRADFDQSMTRNEDSVARFASFIKSEVDKEDLLPFAADGVGAVLEEAVRMAGRQEKLSTAFPKLSDLLQEADYFARQAGSARVGGDHVEQALKARKHRSNLIEEKIQEMIDRGSVMIDVEGEVVGQVNGLAVYSLGEYMFGKPSRITATTSMGKGGIINIEREADLSGKTHNKGMLILSGYLRSSFAQDKPLSMSASIAFEQSYGGVDGDSASSTEMYALLSSLAGVPLRQDLAVTGSVNQRGQVQAIGGVNQKIEGFYACCRSRGLTGEQGVLIPEANVKDLMLDMDVVEAVREGTFHIWAVQTIEQGIELLSGLPAGARDSDGRYPPDTVYGKADARLRELAEGLKEFGKKEEEKGKGEEEKG